MFGFKRDVIHEDNLNAISKWDDEDLEKLSKCLWMRNYKLEDITNEKERREYYFNLLRVMLDCLPKPELNLLKKKLNNKTLNNNPRLVEANVSFVLLDMKHKLRTNTIYKEKVTGDIPQEEVKEIPFYQYRNKQLTTNYLPGTPEYIKQRETIIPGYEPNIDILKNTAPMEVLEYIGITLTKYDMLHGLYSALIEYPSEMNRKPDILFNADPSILEVSAEFMFEEAIEKFKEMKKNPYGSKSFTQIDISNVKEVMNADNENPLEMDIF